MFSPTTTIVPITTKEYKGKNQPTYVRIKQLNKIRLIPLYYQNKLEQLIKVD